MVPNDVDTSFLVILTRFFQLRHYYKNNKKTDAYMLQFSFVKLQIIFENTVVQRFPLVTSTIYNEKQSNSFPLIGTIYIISLRRGD